MTMKMTPVTPDVEADPAVVTVFASTSSESATTAPRPRPSKKLVASSIVFVIAIAIAGYAFTGSPSLARLGARSDASVAGNNAAGDAKAGTEIGLQQIAEMVDKLALRMKSRPDDAEGWTMLARSYAVLGRYAEAVPAYRRATQLEPKDAGLLADFADALGAASEGHVTPEFSALLDRALAIDPHQPKALALAGTIAFERGDYAGAVAHWQKIADALPPGSEFQQQVQANIDEARRRGNLPASNPLSKNRASSVASSRSGGSGVAGVSPGVSGTVTLSAALASRASPTDTVFVFARSAVGSRMPLAVFRATVADLPLHFKLDDSMAMTAMKLSDAKQVIVGARISKSGNAIPQWGDLSGESGPIVPEKNDVAIHIDSVVSAKSP